MLSKHSQYMWIPLPALLYCSDTHTIPQYLKHIPMFIDVLISFTAAFHLKNKHLNSDSLTRAVNVISKQVKHVAIYNTVCIYVFDVISIQITFLRKYARYYVSHSQNFIN